MDLCYHGYQVDQDELRGIANKPSEAYVFDVTGFDELDTIMESVLAGTIFCSMYCSYYLPYPINLYTEGTMLRPLVCQTHVGQSSHNGSNCS